eukprot:gb/GFBE01057813.1/.p1 GENE.gb/GFBE01057813.1/~~gb/GFBE01057813.1/.p1  ORF type:complete len:355 (+),score=55.88 gb/GFBE01057813.1/:1-1065(+)
MAGPCVVDALLEVAQESNVRAVAARAKALEALGPAALQGEERALAVLVSSLEDWDVTVRKVALDAVVEVALKADRRAVYSRLAAVRALAPLAGRGDKKAVDTVVECLKDASLTVRLAAFEELSLIAKEGDSLGGQVAARVAAVQAIGTLAATPGRVQLDAIAVLSGCLTDWHVEVRTAAADGLQGLLGKGRNGSLAAASAAVQAFAPLALEGNSKAMAVLTAALRCHGDDFALLRRQALGGVVRVALGTDSVDEGQLSAKVSAVKTLSNELLDEKSGFSEREKEGIAAALSMCAQDWHADVWREAFDTLCKLAEATNGRGALGQLAVVALTGKARKGEMKAASCLSKLGKLGGS